MLANQGAVALDNAQWTQGLEQKVEERTEALNARVDELAILNSIGDAMAKTLDVRTVTRIVGDKVRDIFHAEEVSIMLLNAQTNLIHTLYAYDCGEGGYVDFYEPFPLGKGLTSKVIQTGRPLLLGTRKEQLEQGGYVSPEVLEKGSQVFTESLMFVPIVVGMQVLGVASVSSYKQSAFSEGDLRLLQTLSANMGVAIQNARLFEAEQQRVAELAILNSIGDAMSKTLDVDTIVHIVGDKVRDIFHTEVASILLYTPQTNLVQMVYSIDKGRRDQLPAPWPLGKGLTSHVIRTRQPLMINTDEEGKNFDWFPNPAAPQDEEPTHSYLGVPIIAGEKVIGVVSVQDYREHAYDEASVRLLSTLAANMGVAIQNAQLFEAEQQRVAELAVINSIQQGLAAELNFQAIVDLVGDKLREVFKVPDLYIKWIDEKTSLINILYAYEHGQRLALESMPLTPHTLFARLMETRQPVVWNTMIEGDQLAPAHPGTDSSKSGVAVPILSGDRALGSIQIENYEREYAYGEFDLRLLTTVTGSLGAALENARLFAETQRLLKETEQRAAELAVINSIQQGVAAELNFQAIVDLVGDKLRQVFTNGDIGIRWYDPQAKTLHFLYEYEHGQRISLAPKLFNADASDRFEARRTPQVYNDAAAMQAAGIILLPGTDLSKSAILLPIIGSDQVIGQIDLENYERENAYSESDVRLLTTVASSMGVALENARLFDETQRLLKETEQRNAELAVINSIQQGLAAELNFQAIVDLVGDKLREVFETGDLMVTWFNEKANLVNYLYVYEHGVRLTVSPTPPKPDGVILTRKMIVWNTDAEGDALAGAPIPGTDSSKSGIAIPMISGDRSLGAIQLENFAREHAYGEAEIRLLTTLAGSLGAALQNAFLFEETQRLLKETEQRNAELAIINERPAWAGSRAELPGHR